MIDQDKEQKKFTTVKYADYLRLEQFLGAQKRRSEELASPAHDEMLFIIVHQVYELWFKQIIHELKSVIGMFLSDNVDERNIGIAVGRLSRVIDIQQLLIEQIRVMESMTPLDFLDFRNYLFPASGFQSFQFRQMEALLGLPPDNRITYNNSPYSTVFNDEERADLQAIEAGANLLRAVESWLERTPFLELKGFNFLEQYKAAVQKMTEKEQEAIRASSFLSDHEKEMRIQLIGNTQTYFQNVFDEEKHEELVAEGRLRLSYKATIAALLLNLYRDEPILHMPFNLLQKLMDVDEFLTVWRYRHAQMVLRMLGMKVGTGGSSGYSYLHKTAVEHHIYIDLHNISTLLIPRSELPDLPEHLKRELGFYFTSNPLG